MSDTERPHSSPISRLKKLQWRLFDIGVAIAMLLAILTAVLWLRSYQVMPTVSVHCFRHCLVEIVAPTDGICLFFEDDSRAGSPLYPLLPGSRAVHLSPLFDSVSYVRAGFRSDLAAYALWMRYRPFLRGQTPRGKFSRFTMRGVLPDNVHEADFGWGIVVPTWVFMTLFAIAPVTWLSAKVMNRNRSDIPAFPVQHTPRD